MADRCQGERFTVTVRATPSTVPVENRLRAWLKIGLRSFGLRCESIEEIKAGRPPADVEEGSCHD